MLKTHSIQLDENFVEPKLSFVETHSIPLPASSAIATPLCGAPETKVKITNDAITSQSMYVELQQRYRYSWLANLLGWLPATTTPPPPPKICIFTCFFMVYIEMTNEKYQDMPLLTVLLIKVCSRTRCQRTH